MTLDWYSGLVSRLEEAEIESLTDEESSPGIWQSLEKQIQITEYCPEKNPKVIEQELSDHTGPYFVLKNTEEIWGQAFIDKGYAVGECNHHYESVHFQGEVQFIIDVREKREALTIMIDQLEEDPDMREKVKKKQLLETALKRVTIGKIIIHEMSGKKG